MGGTVGRPRALRAVKNELSRGSAEVKLVYAALTKLTTEAELMGALDVGNNVGDMAGDVVAAFGRRNPHTVEIADDDLRRSQNRFAVDSRIGAQIQAQGLHVEAVVRVVKDLVEIADARKQLIAQLVRQDGVEHGGVILDMQRCNLEVVAQVRARCRQRQARARRLRLAALAYEIMEREPFFVVEIVIHFADTVIAITGSGNGREVVILGRRQTVDGTRP